jgi:phenylacetate-coenzyme A ligase PaaK-like adenylate-forming protein
MSGILDAASGPLPGVAWPAIVEGPPATVLALARQMEASQWFETATLAGLQFDQLRASLPWLVKHSPAFARRLATARLDIDALATPERFTALPPVERRWFQQEEGVYCDAVPTGHEPVGENVTSGSTGEFLRIRRTRITQLIWLAMILRDHAWRESDFSVPLASVRAPNVGVKNFTDWGPPVSWFFKSGPAMSMPTKLPGHELYHRLAEFGTGNLVIYPNALGTVVDEAAARGSGIGSLRAIRTVGEMVGDHLRERTRAVLGIDIADAYTSQEAGYIALQCPVSGLYHFMAENLIVEVLRDDGTPCGEDEIGRVVITDLHNHATPVVRYAIGDHAETCAPCPCGRGLPTVRRIVGRSRNLIRLPTGDRVWPNLGGFGPQGYLSALPILQFQIVQTELDLLEVRLVTARPFTAEDEQLIVERTQRATGHPFRLEFRYFEGRLPMPESGKFEDFFCLV